MKGRGTGASVTPISLAAASFQEAEGSQAHLRSPASPYSSHPPSVLGGRLTQQQDGQKCIFLHLLCSAARVNMPAPAPRLDFFKAHPRAPWRKRAAGPWTRPPGGGQRMPVFCHLDEKILCFYTHVLTWTLFSFC